MIFQKILVPLDGSEHSRRALDASIQLAKTLNSNLALLAVYSVAGVAGSEPGSTLIALESIRDNCMRTLADAEAKAKAETVEVKTEVVEGNAVDVIVRKAKEGKFDLIVMGARGLSTFKKILVGSVSEGVIKNAPCPVLIVK